MADHTTTGTGPHPEPARKHGRKAAAALTAAAAGAAILAITGTGTAQAAASSPARDSQAAAVRYCGAASTGFSDHTVWVKRADSCRDFNLVQVSASGWYIGDYSKGSNYPWILGSRGYVYCNAGVTRDRVLLSDVRPGVRVAVLRKGTLGKGPRITVNY